MVEEKHSVNINLIGEQSIRNYITFDLEMKRKHPAKSRPCRVAWKSLNLTPSR